MAEPFRFTYGEVTLNNFLQNRELTEKQRQFDLEQSRVARQESLMNLFREKDALISQQNADTSRMNSEVALANTKANILDTFDIMPNNTFAPYAGATNIRPSNAIPGESLLRDFAGNTLVRKQKSVNLDNKYERTVTLEVDGKPIEYGVVKGTGQLEPLGKAYYKPSERNPLDSLADYFKWQSLNAKRLESQATYDTVLTNRKVVPITDDMKKEAPDIYGNYKFYSAVDGKTFYGNSENEVASKVEEYATNKAKKTGYFSDEGRWRKKQIEEKYGEEQRQPSTKVMTREEFIADFEKEEGRKPTGTELLRLRQQGLWK